MHGSRDTPKIFGTQCCIFSMMMPSPLHGCLPVQYSAGIIYLCRWLFVSRFFLQTVTKSKRMKEESSESLWKAGTHSYPELLLLSRTCTFYPLRPLGHIKVGFYGELMFSTHHGSSAAFLPLGPVWLTSFSSALPAGTFFLSFPVTVSHQSMPSCQLS